MGMCGEYGYGELVVGEKIRKENLQVTSPYDQATGRGCTETWSHWDDIIHVESKRIVLSICAKHSNQSES